MSNEPRELFKKELDLAWSEWIEEHPHDASSVQEHFQAEDEFDEAYSTYIRHREKKSFIEGAAWAYEFLFERGFWGRTTSRLQLENEKLKAENERLKAYNEALIDNLNDVFQMLSTVIMSEAITENAVLNTLGLTQSEVLDMRATWYSFTDSDLFKDRNDQTR